MDDQLARKVQDLAPGASERELMDAFTMVWVGRRRAGELDPGGSLEEYDQALDTLAAEWQARDIFAGGELTAIIDRTLNPDDG